MTHVVTYDKCKHQSDMDSDAVLAALYPATQLACPTCGKTQNWKARAK